MGLNLAIVGKQTDAVPFSFTWKDTALYALGVGARASELDFLYEGRGPKVLPTFAVVPALPSLGGVIGELGADLANILHGEQKIVLHRAIPAHGKLTTVREVKAVYDKGKGAVALIETRTLDEEKRPLFDNVFSIFVRGAGGWGGDRGPETPKNDPPGRAPDFEVTETTTHEQALLYRLSGDLNPIHADPDFAKKAGFDRPILHGLCSYGFACRAVVHGAAGGDPSRVRSFAARFSGVVMPGDTLTTRGWKEGSRVIFVTTVGDKVTLSGGVAELG